MFKTKTYINRRQTLKESLKTGLVLLLGHEEAPMNYKDNPYHFRQDSTFLYYFGISNASLAMAYVPTMTVFDSLSFNAASFMPPI